MKAAPLKKLPSEAKTDEGDGEEVKAVLKPAASTEEPEGFNQDRENEKQKNRERLEEIKRKRELGAKEKEETSQKKEEEKKKQEEMLK